MNRFEMDSYTLAVTGSTVGSYTITSAPADDYTNDANSMGTLAIGGTASGALQTIADTDVFKVVLTAGSTYLFDVQGLGDLTNPSFQLIPSSGSTVNSANIGTALRRVSYTASTSGTYTLAVSGGTTGSYYLDSSSRTPSAGSPTISGTAGGQSSQVSVAILPFKTVVIADPTSGAMDTVTISPGSAAIGQFSTLGSGTLNVATGSYVVSGSAAAVTAALNGLVFTPTANQTPPGSSITDRLSISIQSSSGTAAGDASTSLVVSVPVNDPLFDRAYYLMNNPDVAAAGIDPYQHYMTLGWKEGRNPSALFNTNYYLNQNPDVKAAGVNPLAHFEANGWREGRDPSVGFSVSAYLSAYPDVKAAAIDPLVHYVQNGQAEGRTAFAATPHTTGPTDPLVNAAYVYAHNPTVAAAGLDASAWYNSVGWMQGANPDALFDTNYYLTQNPDVKAAGINPLAHFEASGWREGRQPSLAFDDTKYLAMYPDIKAAGIDPLIHYLQNGQYEGRTAFLTGGTAMADPLVNAAYYDAQLGATIIPGGNAGAQQAAWSYDTSGWQNGLNPDALFDTKYYLAHNPDVAAAHVDPLSHYEISGWKEGRDPSASFSTSKYLAAYSDVRAAGVDPLLHYVQNGQAESRTTFSV